MKNLLVYLIVFFAIGTAHADVDTDVDHSASVTDLFLRNVDELCPSCGEALRTLAPVYRQKCGKEPVVKDLRYLGQNTTAYAWLVAVETRYGPNRAAWPQDIVAQYDTRVSEFSCPQD